MQKLLRLKNNCSWCKINWCWCKSNSNCSGVKVIAIGAKVLHQPQLLLHQPNRFKKWQQLTSENPLNTSYHCILISQSPRNRQHKQALDGNNLYLTQVKDKARFSCGLQYPIASCFLPSADAGQFAYKHPSQATVEEPLLSTEDRCNSGVEQVL